MEGFREFRLRFIQKCASQGLDVEDALDVARAILQGIEEHPQKAAADVAKLAQYAKQANPAAAATSAGGALLGSLGSGLLPAVQGTTRLGLGIGLTGLAGALGAGYFGLGPLLANVGEINRMSPAEFRKLELIDEVRRLTDQVLLNKAIRDHRNSRFRKVRSVTA